MLLSYLNIKAIEYKGTKIINKETWHCLLRDMSHVNLKIPRYVNSPMGGGGFKN